MRLDRQALRRPSGRGLGLLLFAAVVVAAVMAAVVSSMATGAGVYDGRYSGSWNACVSGPYGHGCSSGSLGFTLSNGVVTGSSGVSSFSGSVNGSGAGSGSATAVVLGYAVACVWSAQFALQSDGTVALSGGSLSGCHDQPTEFIASGGGSLSAARAAQGPSASTSLASAATDSTATLNGTVNPDGVATTYSFQYGTSSSYGSQTASQSAGSGTTAQTVSATLSGLSPGATYHFRLVATSAAGTSNGSDHAFTTATPPGSGGSGGSAGGGTAGSGVSGGGEALSGSDCLATAGCVVPFLRKAEVMRGTAQLLRADGTTEQLRQAPGVGGNAMIKTGRGSVAAIAFDSADGLTLGSDTSVKVVPRGAVHDSLLCGVACIALVPAIEIAGEVVWRINGGQPPLLLGGFNRYAEAWPDFEGYSKAPILHEGLPSGAPGGRLSPRMGRPARAAGPSAGPVFTLETTPTSMRVSVYIGSVRLRNIRGKRRQTVIVRAGFESTVSGSAPPAAPRRFTPPSNPFWWG